MSVGVRHSSAKGVRVKITRWHIGCASELATTSRDLLSEFVKEKKLEDGVNKIKRTLLVVDDDVEWTDLLRIFFSHKYNVCVSNHADDAIEFLRREMPGAIILDLIMPSVDGFGLMHRMNEMSLGVVPTVLTTGWGNPDVEQCAAAVGCAAVLTKPVSLVELDATVSALMDGHALPQKSTSFEPPDGRQPV